VSCIDIYKEDTISQKIQTNITNIKTHSCINKKANIACLQKANAGDVRQHLTHPRAMGTGAE
jgi:hypothetical protein